MEEDRQKYDVAYFRELNHSDQCELHFFINTEVPIFGIVKEEIKAVRQRTDTVSSLRQHIKNKLQKIFQEKFDFKDTDKEYQQANDIIVSLKRGNKNIKNTLVLKNFINALEEDGNVIFQVFDQKFTVLLNAPLVKQMQLPQILYANFTIQPIKFHAIFTNNNDSLFYWHKSTNKVTWEQVGKGFKYLIKEEDVDHYLKLVCIPLNIMKVKGPTGEVISQNKVEMMGTLPACPFEKRHEFTKKKLKGLEQVESKHIVLSIEIQSNKTFGYIWNVIKRNDEVRTAFLKQSTSLQVTVLKMKGNNKHLIIANTHLFYHPDADHIRLLQVNAATTYLNNLKQRYLRGDIDVSVIFCGDFNSCPEKSLFPYMIQGRINPQHKDCLKIGEILLYHQFIFTSSCGTPKYTNYTPDYKGCLDYIFIETNKIKVQQVVPLTEEEELNKYEGLPNDYFPSDHLALVADLKFKRT
ncbi:hypothetical protein NQ314_000028 [Rhamnusium bicolor]|uniref:Endonuclease/exonuclease/phosphatase domain-containing protein n=1 Tax=Rhamnusium bicolor TaxID=1586634 RepID=A0AAV8ZVT0_9CUCU|nr:hypothetical protein NQ314_000028 [Rhamnusium bicolor]